MKHLYVFDNKQHSSQCGLETYLKNLVAFVSRWKDFEIYFIMLRTRVEKCMACTCKGLNYILVPEQTMGKPTGCDALSCLLPFIEDGENSIFMYNHISCADLIHSVKTCFPLSKHVCVLHNLSWAGFLLGDERKLRAIANKSQYSTSRDEILRENIEKEKSQFSLVEHIICLSEDTQDILWKFYKQPQEKITLIPNALPISFARKSMNIRLANRHKYHIADSDRIILTVGRISAAKGTFVFLNAFKKILRRMPDCRWVIAGELNNASVLLSQAGESIARITLLGYVDKKHLLEWYQMADIGIIPSYTEQCSYAGLEMMAHGLPVVASDGLGVRCMFQNVVNAYVAHIGSRKSSKTFERNLTDCVLRLIDNEKEKERLRQNGYRILRERYAPAEMEKRYKALFENL